MTIRDLRSRAQAQGHPIQSMLAGFPIALYTSGLISLITFGVIGDIFWYRAAMTMWFVGVAMALVSAFFGAIDMYLGVPHHEGAARKTGLIHAGLNVASLVLFAGAAIALYLSWRHPADGLPYALPLVLGVVGLAVTGGAGSLGWKLVQMHRTGAGDSGEHRRERDSTLRPRPLAH